MAPIFAAAKNAPKRIAFAEGEDERVLRAAQTGIDEGIVVPCWSAAPTSSQPHPEARAAADARQGLRGRQHPGRPALSRLLAEYYLLARRKGVNRPQAQEDMRTRPTLVGAMLRAAAATPTRCCAAPCGNYADHLRYVRQVIGMREGVQTLAAMQMLILPGRQLFICDTHVNRDPTAERSPR